ncbi:hypothetical protein CI109_103721 [Kwoniella shandongensis]|uniref:Uncharacterized protein n=1 Tax=Kwoniella shandongensis TaxID=1734106 RepID=A0A5M6C806_9TREE|nr:uncharacterized protein CI109_000583 [Kwoniella shandongensis]KAA5531011.1 hypothetical protein CI109_000583 [Kwoniella shandongensis]
MRSSTSVQRRYKRSSSSSSTIIVSSCNRRRYPTGSKTWKSLSLFDPVNIPHSSPTSSSGGDPGSDDDRPDIVRENQQQMSEAPSVRPDRIPSSVSSRSSATGGEDESKDQTSSKLLVTTMSSHKSDEGTFPELPFKGSQRPQFRDDNSSRRPNLSSRLPDILPQPHSRGHRALDDKLDNYRSDLTTFLTTHPDSPYTKLESLVRDTSRSLTTVREEVEAVEWENVDLKEGMEDLKEQMWEISEEKSEVEERAKKMESILLGINRSTYFALTGEKEGHERDMDRQAGREGNVSSVTTNHTESKRPETEMKPKPLSGNDNSDIDVQLSSTRDVKQTSSLPHSSSIHPPIANRNSGRPNSVNMDQIIDDAKTEMLFDFDNCRSSTISRFATLKHALRAPTNRSATLSSSERQITLRSSTIPSSRRAERNT